MEDVPNMHCFWYDLKKSFWSILDLLKITTLMINRLYFYNKALQSLIQYYLDIIAKKNLNCDILTL